MIERFLQQIELKAFKMALMATKSEADALDLVQNSMMKLVEKYANHAEQELKPLFYAILQNQIKNWFRSESQRSKWFFWQKTPYDDDDETELSQPEGVDMADPEAHLVQQQESQNLLAVLQNLPIKQQQCFLLRSWEGMSVKETAKVMQCTEGTVKTHMSRASMKLKGCIDTEEFI